MKLKRNTTTTNTSDNQTTDKTFGQIVKADIIKFFVLYLLFAIKILRAVGNPNWAILFKSKKVGIIIE